MDFEFKGGNCVRITTKSGILLTDPNIADIGLKDPLTTSTNTVILTQLSQGKSLSKTKELFVIDGPGEYEVNGFAIRGLVAQAHTDAAGDLKTSTIYRIAANDLNVVVVGNIYPELSDDQLEVIGVVDVVIVPVGGHGYTLDAIGAAHITRRLDPKIIIPTHYADDEVSYPIPQDSLDSFVQEMHLQVQETDKLRIKSGALDEGVTIYQLKRT